MFRPVEGPRVVSFRETVDGWKAYRVCRMVTVTKSTLCCYTGQVSCTCGLALPSSSYSLSTFAEALVGEG